MTRQLIVNGVDFTDTLAPGEVARLFGIDRKTVCRWAQEGRLCSIRTPGGHRRFSAAQVEALARRGGRPPKSGSAVEPDTP